MAYSNSRQRNNERVRFDLMENLLVFGQRKDTGWTKEANIVCWNSGSPKLDIREWDPDHMRMSKGVTLYEAEAERLAKVLCRRYGLTRGGGREKGSSYESFTDEDALFEDENFASAESLPDEKYSSAEEADADAEEAVTAEEEGGTS